MDFTIQGMATDSGVSEQPMGLEETIIGAKNRAASALAAVTGAVIGIGLESGLVVADGNHFDFCACDIFDGKNHHVGLSSMFPLPKKVVAALEEKGYNEAFRHAGVEPQPTGNGVLGKLSGTREYTNADLVRIYTVWTHHACCNFTTGDIMSRPAQMKQSVSFLRIC